MAVCYVVVVIGVCACFFRRLVAKQKKVLRTAKRQGLCYAAPLSSRHIHVCLSCRGRNEMNCISFRRKWSL